MQPATLTQEQLNDVYRRRKKQFQNFLRYGNVRSGKYPGHFDEKRGWVLEMKKIEHDFHLRCQGCNQPIEANVEVIGINLGGAWVFCHKWCLTTFRWKKPNLLKKDVDRYKTLDKKLAQWIGNGIAQKELRKMIMTNYNLSRQPADRKMRDFLRRHKDEYVITKVERKGRGRKGYYITPKSIVETGISEYEFPPSPYQKRRR